MPDLADEIKIKMGLERSSVESYEALFDVQLGHTRLAVAADDEVDALRRSELFRTVYFDVYGYEPEDFPEVIGQFSESERRLAILAGANGLRMMSLVERQPLEAIPTHPSWNSTEMRNFAKGFLNLFGIEMPKY